MRSWIVLLLFSVFAAAPAATRAGSVLLEAPAQYTPLDSFAVSVRLSAVTDLALYNIELVIRASGHPASLLTVAAPAAPVLGYVFPTAGEFLANRRVLGEEYRITLSDFLLTSTGVDVSSGMNDLVVVLTVTPAAEVSGPITVSVDPVSLQLDDSDGNSLSTSGPAPAVVLTEVVPSPPSLVCSLISLASFAARDLARRRAQTA